MPDDVGAHVKRPPPPAASPFARLVDGVLEKIVAAAIIWGATRASGIVDSITELNTEVKKLGYMLELKTEHDLGQDARLERADIRLEKLENRATRTLPVK